MRTISEKEEGREKKRKLSEEFILFDELASLLISPFSFVRWAAAKSWDHLKVDKAS